MIHIDHLTTKNGAKMIRYEFSCDFRGCEVRAASVATHAAVMPGDWGHVSFLARDVDKNECSSGAHLCPKHAEEVGKQLARWTVSGQNVEEPPERFR